MSCDRFEREGLPALENGAPLDPHFDTCPECMAARAAYERLRRELGEVYAGAEPPAGWQARVRQAIEERRGLWRRWPWPWIAVPAAAAAGLLAFVLLRPPPAERLAVAVQVVAGETVRRGTEAHPGDRLRISAATSGARHAELRVYRNDQGPLLACSTALPCRQAGGVLEADFVLPSAGSYQVLLLASESSLPEGSTGTLDSDAARALAAGARVELGEEVEAR